jgi:hypothetical protein
MQVRGGGGKREHISKHAWSQVYNGNVVHDVNAATSVPRTDKILSQAESWYWLVKLCLINE